MCLRQHPGRSIPTNETQYPSYRRLNGPRDSRRVGEISPSPELAIRTVKPVAISYTSRAIPAGLFIVETKRNTIITYVGEIKSYLPAVQVEHILVFLTIVTDSIEWSPEETNIRSAY